MGSLVPETAGHSTISFLIPSQLKFNPLFGIKSSILCAFHTLVHVQVECVKHTEMYNREDH